MSKNFILGSGVTGLLAKMILGQDWEIIPFGKSRFYSWKTPLDDNYIIHDSDIDDFVRTELKAALVRMYSVAFSVQGKLTFQYDQALSTVWGMKIFGDDIPGVHDLVMKSRMTYGVYDGLQTNVIYKTLMEQYFKDLANKPKLTAINGRTLVVGDQQLTYDKVVSTIPLNTLLGYLGYDHNLKSKNIYYHHIHTPDLNFEGANQVLVVDNAFSFYRVINHAPNQYVFYGTDDIPKPGMYFQTIIGNNFDIIEGTMIKDALPVGERPDMSILENSGIYCIGKHAEWDYWCDLGSCIMRLLKLANRLPSH